MSGFRIQSDKSTGRNCFYITKNGLVFIWLIVKNIGGLNTFINNERAVNNIYTHYCITQIVLRRFEVISNYCHQILVITSTHALSIEHTYNFNMTNSYFSQCNGMKDIERTKSKIFTFSTITCKQ